FRERCSGVAWELATMQATLLYALVHLGELRKVDRLGEQYLRAAEERGDLYAVTSLRVGPLANVHLAANRPEEARRDSLAALARWSTSGFHLQHYYHLMSILQTYQYVGDYAGAQKVLEEATPALEASMLLRFQVLRVFFWAM